MNCQLPRDSLAWNIGKSSILQVLLILAITGRPESVEATRCELINNKELNCKAGGFQDIGQLPDIPSVVKIDLTSNNITSIPTNSLDKFPHLQVLLLRRNHLKFVNETVFENLTQLTTLEMDDNEFQEFPTAISYLRNLEELSLANNKIHTLLSEAFRNKKNLLSIDLRGNPLREIQESTFTGLSQLRKLILSDVQEIKKIPNLQGCNALEMLTINRAQLRHVPDDLCQNSPILKTLDLKSNYLTAIPNLKDCLELRVLDLGNNRITSLSNKPFKTLNALHDLLIFQNRIQLIPEDAFTGLIHLQVLNLESNLIKDIHPEAFTKISQLEDLNLGNNIFPTLPTAGLGSLLHLKTFNNPVLRDFPPPEQFPKTKTMVLSYAYHCCPFVLAELMEEPTTKLPLQESVLFPTDNDFDLSLWSSNNFTDIWPRLNNLSSKFGTRINELWDNMSPDFTHSVNLAAYVEEYSEEDKFKAIMPGYVAPQTVHCLPQPGPFLPCRDLFDWWTLRCGVWIVFLLAILGNGTVVFVLIFSRSKMDVPRFLVCNLAAADFFMGVYLGILAIVDASTLGQFRMYAIPWQMSVGCQLAGFLGVLSSELSVYTLAVITLERNYAITHAMHLNKRLSLRHAAIIMVVGWMFSTSMACLPFWGFSDYRKFAICLPFETTTVASLAYVVSLMVLNGIAFLILTGCYLKMYCAIRGSQAWNSNDSRIAKRMALLVFTDLICWFPIAFFSLTAAFGLQLVSLEHAKVFAVFVLPLNSCCNPFLYAILTKQFKKECILICKAIEESRVSRNVSKCRYSSNVSNRMTPANSNTIPDRINREQNNYRPKASHVCTCSESSKRFFSQNDSLRCWSNKLKWPCNFKTQTQRRQLQVDQYTYQIAEFQQTTKQNPRASSMSSSTENYSSSRSDSWKQSHSCGIQLRLFDSNRKSSKWSSKRKSSQDSNLSSSKNDSSGSNTTGSTGTWKLSRSTLSLELNLRAQNARPNITTRSKARLTRQMAIQDPESPTSPGKLAVRLLATIPSAAEMSEHMEDDSKIDEEKEEKVRNDKPSSLE